MRGFLNFGDDRLPEHFWDKASPCPVSGCWLWTGYAPTRIGRAHPKFRGNGKSTGVRRYVAVSVGLADPEFVGRVFSSCGVDLCVNPFHFLVKPRIPKGSIIDHERGYRLAWHQKNRHKRRDYRLRAEYGITNADVEAMIVAQDGCCQICRIQFNNDEIMERPHVDHCHKTGEVRAILCARCNVGLGMFKDSPSVLRIGADYLERFASKWKRG